MRPFDHNELPAELRDLDQLLREQRPEATPLELERPKDRALARAARDQRSRQGFLMKPRLAITSLLVCGIMLSGVGASLAVSGISDRGSAGKSAYTIPTNRQLTPAPAEEQGAAPVGDESPGGEGGGENPVDLQADKQEGSGGGGGNGNGNSSGRQTLPFSGLAAIPILLLGLVSAGAGLALQKRNRES